MTMLVAHCTSILLACGIKLAKIIGTHSIGYCMDELDQTLYGKRNFASKLVNVNMLKSIIKIELGSSR